MIPAAFDYIRAQSVEEAIGLLGEHPEAKLLAGGHSLLPVMKQRLAQPPVLVDIGRLEELRGIEERGDELWIGALTTHHELHGSPRLREACPLLSEAAGTIGDPAVRHRGTLGGNVSHADPASDLPAALVALEATFQLRGPGGERSVVAGRFFQDLLTTDLRPGEILTGATVRPRPGVGACYLKNEHPASGYAICGAAALVERASGRCEWVRLCFNGITATPFDAVEVAEALQGRPGTDAEIDEAAGSLVISEPLGDVHASAPYRAELAKVYGRRALKEARDRAGA